MRSRWTIWVTLGLWALTFTIVACVLTLMYKNEQSSGLFLERAGVFVLTVCALVNVGAILAIHRPRNPIGWIFLIAALSQAIIGASDEYASYITSTAPGTLPEFTLLFWLGSWVWIFVFVVPPTLGLLLFPTGRLPSARWRFFAYLTAFFIAEGILATMFRPGSLTTDGQLLEITNPIGIEWLGTIFNMIPSVVDVAMGFVLVAGAVLSIFARLRVAGMVERQQIKWLAIVGIVAASGLLFEVVAVAVTGLDSETDSGLGSVIRTFRAFAIAFIPIAVGIAILRHNLYDIDRLINRTAVYGSLTIMLLLSFAGSVIFFQFLLDPLTGGNDLAVAGSTLLVAALFRPARNRLQQFVDRRFYRRKYDAQQILQMFSVTARDAVQLEEIADDLTHVVARTVQPAHVSIWLNWLDVREERQ